MSGLLSFDDAGVHILSPELALVQSVDFFTPIVDDPFTFGAIATTNALSDIYAMGATPISALNIAAFPCEVYGPDVLAAVIAGGLSVLDKAGVKLLGGHTIADDTFKFGVAVTGTCHPDRILTNRNAVAGDDILLTKQIGTGVYVTGAKAGAVSGPDLDVVVDSMLTLNDTASRIAATVGIPHPVHTATDITGFGLIGHLSHWLTTTQTGIEIDPEAVPLFPHTLTLISQGYVSGGAYNNADFTKQYCRNTDDLGPMWLALNDPQTSGGLCFAVDPQHTHRLQNLLVDAGIPTAIIGKVAGPAGTFSFKSR